MNPGRQKQLSKARERHTDHHMILRVLAKLRNDQAGGVFFSRTAVGYEKERVGFASRQELRGSGQTLSVGSRLSKAGQLLRRSAAEPFPDGGTVAGFEALLE